MSNVGILRCLSLVRIAARFARALAGSMPRSASLAPSSRIAPLTFSGTAQSKRASPGGGGVTGHTGVENFDLVAVAPEVIFQAVPGTIYRVAVCSPR